MGFFNTFSEIANNQDNFHQWEQNRADEDAKREKYFQQNPISEQKKKEAEEFGRVLIDTVDFMDAKSENKAESVEMACDIGTGVLGAAGTMTSMVLVVKDQLKKLKEIEKPTKELSNLINNFRPEKVENYDKILEDLLDNNLVKKSEHGFIDFKGSAWGQYQIFNKEKFNKLNETTKKYFSSAINEKSLKAAKKSKGFGTRLLIVPALTGLVVGAIGQTIGTILQVKGSKIARYQARQCYDDPRNFVEYTDAQRAEAEKYLDEVKVRKLRQSGSLRDIFSLMKDNDNYIENSKKFDGIHLYDIDEKDPQKAYENQRILNKCVTKINNTAEEYSENMETAAGVLFGSSIVGGFAIGKLAQFIMNTAEKIKNKGKDIVKKPPLEEAGEIFSDTKSSKWKKIGKTVWVGFKAQPAIFTTLLATLIFVPIVTKLQKNASRAGRYQAKRDLEENPQNFIYVNQQDLDKIDEKGNVKKTGVLDIAKSIPKSIKTSFEYDKYKKTKLKEQKKMQEALEKVEVTDEQMKKAENLKTRLYKSFDIIDDHSQEYSEKMEAACEVGQDVLGFATGASLLLPAAIFFKYPHKFLKPASDLLATVFTKFDGLAKKYTKNIGKHITNKTNQKIIKTQHFKDLQFAQKDIDEILKTADEDVFAKKLDALRTKLNEKFAQKPKNKFSFDPKEGKKTPDGDYYHTKKYIDMIKDFRKEHLETAAAYKDLGELANQAEGNISLKEFSDMLKKIDDPKLIRNSFDLTAEKLNLVNADFSKVSDKDLLKIKDNAAKVIETIPVNELATSFKKLTEFKINNPTKAMIEKNRKIKLSAFETYVTGDVKTVFFSLAGLYAAGMLSFSYLIERFLSTKTKEAGRLGTMKAEEALNAENDQFIKAKATA